MSSSTSRQRIHAWILGGAVTAIFFTFLISVLIFVAPRGASFLYLEVYYFLPISPLFAVWLYFLFRAIVPITGGMPGKGFRQWFYAYLFALSALIYLIAVTFTLDFLFPQTERYYTENIFPWAIVAVTLYIVSRIPRVNRFMWKVFGEDKKVNK